MRTHVVGVNKSAWSCNNSFLWSLLILMCDCNLLCVGFSCTTKCRLDHVCLHMAWPVTCTSTMSVSTVAQNKHLTIQSHKSRVSNGVYSRSLQDEHLLLAPMSESCLKGGTSFVTTDHLH